MYQDKKTKENKNMSEKIKGEKSTAREMHFQSCGQSNVKSA